MRTHEAMNPKTLENKGRCIALGLFILVSGCAAPDPHPFQQYATAVKDTGNGLEQLLTQDVAWSKERYIESVLSGSTSLRNTAVLDEKQRFTISFPTSEGITNQPTFYKLQNAQATLLNLNDATEKYVNLLTTLAGADLVNPTTFESMAKDTDASLNAATKQLDLQVPGGALHVFSVGSSEIIRLLIEHRRQAALIKVLTESQPAIDAYSDKCLRLLTILDQSLLTDYQAQAFFLDDAFSRIPAEKRPEDPKARAAVEQLIKLNSDYLTLVQSLKSLHKVFETLPKGHRELLKSAQKQPTSLEEIRSLAEEAKRLQSIYKELNQPNAGKKG